MSAAFFLFPSEVEVEVSFMSTFLVSSSSYGSLFVFLDTSDTLAMFLCHRALILLNNPKTGELDLEGLWRRRRRRLVVLPQEAICGFPSWRKPGRKILLKLLVHPLQGEDGADDDDDVEHGVVGSERSSSSITVCKVGVVMMSSSVVPSWCRSWW